MRLLVAAVGFVGRNVAHDLRGVVNKHAPVVVDECGCDIAYIVTLVPVDRKSDVDTELVQIPQPHAGGKDVHLPPRIVDIVFTVDIVTDRTHQRCHRCAVGGAAAVADMEGAGRIRRHKLDLHFLTVTDLAGTEAVATVQYRAYDVERGLLVQEEIDEARPRDLDLVHVRVFGQCLDQITGQFARLPAGTLGQHHRNVRGEVPVGGVTCAGYLDPWLKGSIQYFLLLQLFDRLFDQAFDVGFQDSFFGSTE